MHVKELLGALDIGKSVAEFDEALEEYFVETNAFRALVESKIDIVAGDKGTGKTAIYRILKKKYTSLPNLGKVEVLAAFNPTGNSVFQKLAEQDVLDEGEYIRLWKTYILSFAGNWLLGIWSGSHTASMRDLDILLRGLELRTESDSPHGILAKTLAKIGMFFRWKSAEVGIEIGETGLPKFIPKIEFDRDSAADFNKHFVSIESALGLLNKSISEADLSIWVAIDRLDEAFQGFPAVEIPALRGLFRTYLDLMEFDRLKVKLFVRRDLFRRITAGGFVNLTHVNARKFEIIWDEEDLLNLLCRRIKKNKTVNDKLELATLSDKAVFNKIFPQQVDLGKRKPQTWTWIMRRIRDGNDLKPPRNLIDLIEMARQAQLRREEREGRDLSNDPLIEPDALRRGLSQLSKERVLDTLLAEAGPYRDAIGRFRDGKAEHNTESLADCTFGFE